MEKGFIVNIGLVGEERKVIMTKIAEALNTEVKYAGVPTFAYEAGGWSINKDGNLSSRILQLEEIAELATIVEVLMKNNITTQGSIVTGIIRNDFTEDQQYNFRELLKRKGNLIQKSFGINSFEWRLLGGMMMIELVTPSIELADLPSFMTFLIKVSELASNIKHVSMKETEVENEKYAFRCFLLRLGFVGEEYKKDRQILLKRLSGNTAFKEARKCIGD